MRWRNAGGAAQADPLGRVVPLWNVLMSGTGHSRDDGRGMDGRDGLATGHSSPDHDLSFHPLSDFPFAPLCL